MKMPGTLNFGVQSLGRPDKGAMRAKYSAEQQAGLAWGKALATAGNEVAKVATAEGLADANLTLSERVAMDKKSTAELDQYLANTMTVDLNDETVPAAVRTAAERAGYEDGVVDTYQIAVEASKQHFEQSRKDSAEAIGKQMQPTAALTKYNQQMDTSWARSAQSATKVHIIQRIQHLSARADLMYNEALNNLDEESMLKIAVEAEQTGVWTPEYAGDKVAAVGSTVDQVAATRRYSDAKTQGDLDAADDFVDQSRIDPDSRITMMKLSRQTAEFMHTQEMRKQPVNYAKAQATLIDGKLTKGMVADMARKQEISGAHANTLRNALSTPAPLTSTPEVVDQFTGQIAQLRFPDLSVDPDSVKARAEKLRQDFQVAYTGAGKDGVVVPRSLTGADFADLMEALDKEVNTALGKGGRVDNIAMQQIKQLTGYTDFIAEALGSNYPKARAKADFERALIDYKDANPTGDAMEFVARNAHMFTADSYVKEYADTLSQQFPMYATSGKSGPLGVVSNNQLTIKDVVMGEGSAATLLFRARTDMLKGVITEEDFQRLRRGLEYKYAKVQSGARKSDE